MSAENSMAVGEMTLETAKDQIMKAVSLEVNGRGLELTLEALLRAMPSEWRPLVVTGYQDPYPKAVAEVVTKATLELVQEGKLKFVPSLAVTVHRSWQFSVQLAS